LNPGLGAFVAVENDAMPASASVRASPLAGTTFAVKDNIDVRGLASHCGLRALRAEPAARDAIAVARLKAAGLVCLGKLNMHPMALGATNRNPDFGDCDNPRRVGYTPGGSSGGSAVAVAAGLCAVALGTDTMGSVRIPAAYCGTVGFKPSFGAVAMAGVTPLCHLLDHVGILARNVEDVIEAFRVVGDFPAGSLAADAASGAPTEFEFAVPANLDVLRLTPVVRDAFESALARLRRRGVALRSLDLRDYPFTRARRAGLLLCEAELLSLLAEPLAARRAEMPSELLAMLNFAAGKSAVDLARALAVVVDAGLWVEHALLPFDALLLPTAAQTAFAMAGPVPPEQADLTAMANMSGGPAISLPLPMRPEDLPVGLQVMGRRGSDSALLDAAAFLEGELRVGAGE
jgi:aspartyl-tRNA(Asn)/glutamyl-tRNA(Gln) amidotransferase subunit A